MENLIQNKISFFFVIVNFCIGYRIICKLYLIMNYFNVIVSKIYLYLYYKYIASQEDWAYEVGCNKHLHKILLLLKKQLYSVAKKSIRISLLYLKLRQI